MEDARVFSYIGKATKCDFEEAGNKLDKFNQLIDR